jgi:alpha-beta hydrolase superfamily lysophospholipase
VHLNRQLCAVAGVLALSVSCKPRSFNTGDTSSMAPLTLKQPATSTNVSAEAQKVWDSMTKIPYTPQPGCEPAHYAPPAGVKYRGVAVLLHGFSACPQQYEQLGPQLANAGYEVFVPLFPGHGAPPTSLNPREDNVLLVPRSVTGWTSFTSDVNNFAALFKGEKVLVGLSQGANIALRATQLAPNLYDKAFIMSFKLRNETAMFSGLFSNSVHILNIDEYVLGMRSGWRRCEEVDSLPPHNRAGFCNMENRNAIAMLDFGKNAIDKAVENGKNKVKTRTPIQVVLSHSDDGTCNKAAEEVLAGMHQAGSNMKACIMPKEVPHSMFSLHDTPYEKPWVPALFKSVENFLVNGTNVPGSSDTITDCRLTW